ncbi:MAG: GDP-mannose 4,6-dehydratase [Parvibaculum sp.]|nr:GDP-mannose 4,6-dehydratase [Parvibaculum sp.]
MSSNEKFLILGSNSFSGATFADYLAGQGYDVVATSRSPEPHDAFLPYKWQKRAGTVTFETVDINNDLDKLDEILRRVRPSHVVNFAAQSMVGESWKYPDHWMMTNVVSTVRLHERLRHLDFLDRYVHVTTPEVYGSTDGWIKEDMPLNPTTPYAVSRAAGDMSLKTYVKQHGFPAVSTRAANVFGPGQQLYRIVPRTILFAMTGRKLQLHGGGHSIRSFIDMRDVSAATLAIALKGTLGDTYHISTPRLISICELVEMIVKRLGKDMAQAVEIVDERPGKDTAYMLNSDKLRTELGWSDKISLEQGLEDTILWAEKYIDQLQRLPADYMHKP